MRTILAGLALFVAQIYLTFRGTHHFSKYWNPLILFLVSAAIAVLYFYQRLQQPANRTAPRPAALRLLPALLWALAGAFTMLLAYEELRKLLVQFPDPSRYSDVLPQLEAQFQRFSRGEMPYAPVPMPNNSPFPVYMPLHWLPIGIGTALAIDPRWVGYGLMVLAAGVYGWFVGRQHAPLGARIAALFLPSMGLWGFILWGTLELPVSFETVVAAYYLVLAAALLGRHLGVLLLGLILCLLSRYTLLFWLPLLAWVLWQEYPRRANYLVWASAALSVLLLYVLPFYLRDPSIFMTGIKYHNDGAAAEWAGFGDPPISWSMEKGIYFAINMKAIFSGDAAHQVLLARATQATVMLVLFGFGLWAYRRWKTRIDGYSLCLVMLYAFVGCFYFSSPMTFQYYFLVLFMLSATVVAKIFTNG